MPKIKHLRIDFSALSSWRGCPARFMGYYVDGLRPAPQSDMSAADMGTLIHTCLEQYYKGEAVQKTNIEKVDTVVEKYIETHPKEDEHFDVVAVEKQVEVNVNDWLTLVMSIDLIAIDKYTKEHLIIDHKTTSWVSFLSNKINSIQFDTYMYGCQHLGYNVYNGIINGISTDLTKKDKYQRHYISRSPFHIERWRHQMIADCHRIRETIEEERPATQVMSDECFKFKRPCFMHSVCTASSQELADTYRATLEKSEWKNFSIEYEEEIKCQIS